MYFEIGALKNFGNFTGAIHALECLFKKVSDPHAWNRLQYRYFPAKLARFSRALFLQNIPGGWFLK